MSVYKYVSDKCLNQSYSFLQWLIVISLHFILFGLSVFIYFSYLGILLELFAEPLQCLFLSCHHPQVLYWLWPLPELVPRALCWHLAERGQSHWCLCLSPMSVNRRCHDSSHTTYRKRLWWIEKNITLITSMLYYYKYFHNTFFVYFNLAINGLLDNFPTIKVMCVCFVVVQRTSQQLFI